MPGQGLITQILKRTEPVVHKRPAYTLHRHMIQSASDQGLLNTIIRIGDKQRKKEPLTRIEAKELRRAIKKLEERGAITSSMIERWPE